ncbi:NAD-dependent epimerase/dehydratase family protein [Xylophilus ampelinus]|uniref:Nucleoside-diphosphate-sugar epimerase n=1 Tax=Xylophilus ampelinus TaxID=54067 RepID=A0A318SJU8_9BURK|nr:NAD(P)-dependent oxidoreductase [Xylophilus ampelinus]MCS4509754.1 NAD(P)-dependent oxidoreductase [Xylophilus ampelinus]PYE78718.1 nucleoside-diphosphate-sugar epimerase [Xylophilus ampelinus]
MRYCVIGAGGYVGRFLCEHLVRQEHSVEAVSSSRPGGIDPVTGLLGKLDLVGIDVVVYLAQSPFYRQLPQRASHLVSVNCVSAVQAAITAQASNVSKFIYASTGNVYRASFDPFKEDSPLERRSWYPLSKILGEEGVRLAATGMDLTCLRIFGVYGPNQTDKLIPNLVARVIRGETVTVDRQPSPDESEPGGMRTNPIYIDDAVRAIETVAGLRGLPVMNFAGDEMLSIRQMVEIIGEVVGISPKVAVNDRVRTGDLIGDVSLFRSHYTTSLTTFKKGIQKVLEASQ